MRTFPSIQPAIQFELFQKQSKGKTIKLYEAGIINNLDTLSSQYSYRRLEGAYLSFSLSTFVFLTVVTALFFSIRKEARIYILLIASLLYIYYLDQSACIALLSSSAVVYGAGLYGYKLKNNRKREKARAVLWAGIVLLILFWLSFKILPRLLVYFTADQSIQNRVLNHLILPIGYSYYMFQAISYLSDIHSEKIIPEKNFFTFLLYMCYFPKFISGPIEKPEIFLGQLKNITNVKFFDEERLSSVLGYFLYGYFMKIVVADRLEVYVSPIFNDFQNYTPLALITGSLFYAIQIYCDFAGYSALAVGISRIFGIELTQNFLAPYRSVDISDFWRRWHISLSTWLRNYIYIPLGGNRKGKIRQGLNSMAVFLLCGIWHGNGFNYIAWGLLHGLYTVIHMLIKNKIKHAEDNHLIILLRRVSTFMLVTFAWIFFRAPGLHSAAGYIRKMITGWGAPGIGLRQLGIDSYSILFLAVCFISVYLMDRHVYRKGVAWPDAMMQWHYIPRYTVYLIFILVIFVFGIYGPGYDTGKFLYMNY